MSKYVKYTYVSTQNFVGIRSSKLFEVKSGHKKSLVVKQGSNPSIKRQIGPVGRNISNIHIFRLRILSEIDIQNYSRSYQVIKSHQRSNLSKTCQTRVKSVMLQTDSELVKNFRSFKVYIIKIESLGGALEPFSGFCSFCSRAPPRDQIFKKKSLCHKLRLRAFRCCMTY